MKKEEVPGWVYYYENERGTVKNSGKWMHFFKCENYEFAEELCAKAINEKISTICKHTSKTSIKEFKTGVCCFYCDGTDEENMKKIIKFFIDNNLIKKTEQGQLYNISFKFDEQTKKKEYENTYKAKIKLSDFIDLKTCKWL